MTSITPDNYVNDSSDSLPPPAGKVLVTMPTVTINGRAYTHTVEMITPEVAGEFLAHNTYNRPMKTMRVQGYATDMLSGAWDYNGDPIRFNCDGTLIDGQNRCQAIIESGVSQEMLVIRGMSKEQQKTMDGGAKRHLSDHLVMLKEKNATTLATILRGVTMWEISGSLRGVRAGSYITVPMAMSRLAAYDKWIRDAIPVVRYAKKIGLPGSVVGPIWWKAQMIDPVEAEDFFEKLARADGHPPGSPFLALRRVGLDYAISSHRNTHQIAAQIILAWNAYRDGLPVETLAWHGGGAKPDPFPEMK